MPKLEQRGNHINADIWPQAYLGRPETMNYLKIICDYEHSFNLFGHFCEKVVKREIKERLS